MFSYMNSITFLSYKNPHRNFGISNFPLGIFLYQWGRRCLSPFAYFQKRGFLEASRGTEVPVPSVPSVPLRLPYPFNRQQASLFCLKNIQSGVVVATWDIFANYFARCCITGNKAKVHQLITVAIWSNNDI